MRCRRSCIGARPSTTSSMIWRRPPPRSRSASRSTRRCGWRCCPSSRPAGWAIPACPGTATAGTGRARSPSPTGGAPPRAWWSRPPTTAAELTLTLEFELHRSGVLRTRAHLTSTGPGTYWLDHLTLFLPVPEDTVELLDFTGHHLRERSPAADRVHARPAGPGEPHRPHRLRHRAPALRRDGRLRQPRRPGLGRAHRVLRRRPRARRAHLPRPVRARRRRAAAGRRGRARTGRHPTPARGCTARSARPAWTSCPAGSTRSCGTGRGTRRRRGPWSSTPGRRSTSTTTWTG